jgi:hypothetical protein
MRDSEELTEEEKNKLWQDDEFCLEKDRQEMKMEDVKMQTDYAQTMGRSFFNG